MKTSLQFIPSIMMLFYFILLNITHAYLMNTWVLLLVIVVLIFSFIQHFYITVDMLMSKYIVIFTFFLFMSTWIVDTAIEVSQTTVISPPFYVAISGVIGYLFTVGVLYLGYQELRFVRSKEYPGNAVSTNSYVVTPFVGFFAIVLMQQFYFVIFNLFWPALVYLVIISLLAIRYPKVKEIRVFKYVLFMIAHFIFTIFSLLLLIEGNYPILAFHYALSAYLPLNFIIIVLLYIVAPIFIMVFLMRQELSLIEPEVKPIKKTDEKIVKISKEDVLKEIKKGL